MPFTTTLYKAIEAADLVNVDSYEIDEFMEMDGFYKLSSCNEYSWELRDQEIEVNESGEATAVTAEGESVHLEFKVTKALALADIQG